MTELLETVVVILPGQHTSEDPSCPFCPADDEQDSFTTHAGKANDSTVLGDVLENPSLLPSKQSGARPKDGAAKRQGQSPVKSEPKFTHHVYGEFSFEAHHAIPGNQALKGHNVEQWLVAGAKVKADTGYSVNNADNGIWLPSVPDEYNKSKKGDWARLSNADKLEIAKVPMSLGYGQFHKGHHSIRKDEDGWQHKSYIDEVKRGLDDIDSLVQAWSKSCFLCDGGEAEDGPVQPNWKVHDMLDGLSRAIIRELTGSAKTWEFFISALARDYHKSTW